MPVSSGSTKRYRSDSPTTNKAPAKKKQRKAQKLPKLNGNISDQAARSPLPNADLLGGEGLRRSSRLQFRDIHTQSLSPPARLPSPAQQSPVQTRPLETKPLQASVETRTLRIPQGLGVSYTKPIIVESLYVCPFCSLRCSTTVLIEFPTGVQADAHPWLILHP
jgi:hypothetical protein